MLSYIFTAEDKRYKLFGTAYTEYGGQLLIKHGFSDVERDGSMLIVYNRFLKYTFLFLTGGFAYGGIEIMTRGYSHISMMIAGGICFILIGLLNEVFSPNMAIISQMVISALIITAVEFIAGLVVNVWLKLNVWDYSDKPYNLMGQVCLLYTIYWFFLSLVGILMDDLLRYFLLKEEKPHYRIF